MTLHLKKDLDALKEHILSMGEKVASRTRDAIRALVEKDEKLARRVIEGDPEIDQLEIGIEEESLKILALHQPVATDLRWVVSVLKVNSDLERVGDLAVNVAERAAYLATRPEIGIRLDFARMGESALGMVDDCLRSLVELDVALAHQVIAADQEVDDLNRAMFVALEQRMTEDPQVIPRAIHFLSASRHLERIGDHATNIAEDVVFLVEGKVIRHQHEEYDRSE
jgi:phosphate transport system protein